MFRWVSGGMNNHEVIPGREPLLITGGVPSGDVFKFYTARSVTKTVVVGVVVNHNHGDAISVHREYLNNLIVLGVKDGDRVIVEDVTHGIAYPSRVRYGKTVAHIRIPKDFWPYYQKGEEVVALITPITTR